MATLTYFKDIRGAAEPARLILELAGVDFTEKKVEFKEWPPIKDNYPFKQIPFYEDDDVAIPQSMAIVRHLGRKHNLYGTSLKESAQVDVVIEASTELLVAIRSSIAEKSEDKDPEKIENELGRRLDCLQDLLQDNQFFVGEHPTVGDLVLFNVIDNYVRPFSGAILRKRTKLEEWRIRITDIPRIKDYLLSDRRPPCTLAPFFGVLCTPEECK